VKVLNDVLRECVRQQRREISEGYADKVMQELIAEKPVDVDSDVVHIICVRCEEEKPIYEYGKGNGKGSWHNKDTTCIQCREEILSEGVVQ